MLFFSQKHHRESPYDFFYVVLSVYPNNGRRGDCDYESESFKLANNFDPIPYTGHSRVKHVTVTVETALSGELEQINGLKIIIAISSDKIMSMTGSMIISIIFGVSFYSMFLPIGDEYWIAIVVGLTVMFVFYVVCCAWITIFDWWR